MRRDTDPLSADLTEVLQFLTDLLASGKSYSAINIHRSMLSRTLGSIEGVQIGAHPLVVRLMKGCYHKNPPKPKYNDMWDPSQVVEFINSLDENRHLTLSVLASKLVTMIALATLMRASEIAAIGYRSVVFSERGVVFSLDRLRKAQRNGPLQSFSILNDPDPILCPVLALKEFVERTNQFRRETDEGKLFVALIAPHRPVSASTVSRWIKSFLQKAGINTRCFGAHSTRGAAASKAVSDGVPVEAILRAGSWSKETTFNRFYNRASTQTMFVQN